MQLSDMITEARRMFGQTVAANSHVSDPELTGWGNEALRDLISEMDEDPYQEATTTTVLDTETYDLTTRIVTLMKVSLVQEDGTERELPIYNIRDMGERFSPGWRSDPDGVPLAAYKSATNQIGLHPKPNAANASKTLRILYSRYQTDLSASTDTPTMNLVAHDAIPYFMTHKAFLKVRNFDEAKNYLALYEEKKKKHKLNIRRFNKDMSWNWVGDA